MVVSSETVVKAVKDPCERAQFDALKFYDQHDLLLAILGRYLKATIEEMYISVQVETIGDINGRPFRIGGRLVEIHVVGKQRYASTWLDPTHNSTPVALARSGDLRPDLVSKSSDELLDDELLADLLFTTYDTKYKGAMLGFRIRPTEIWLALKSQASLTLAEDEAVQAGHPIYVAGRRVCREIITLLDASGRVEGDTDSARRDDHLFPGAHIRTRYGQFLASVIAPHPQTGVPHLLLSTHAFFPPDGPDVDEAREAERTAFHASQRAAGFRITDTIADGYRTVYTSDITKCIGEVTSSMDDLRLLFDGRECRSRNRFDLCYVELYDYVSFRHQVNGYKLVQFADYRTELDMLDQVYMKGRDGPVSLHYTGEFVNTLAAVPGIRQQIMYRMPEFVVPGYDDVDMRGYCPTPIFTLRELPGGEKIGKIVAFFRFTQLGSDVIRATPVPLELHGKAAVDVIA